MWNFFSKKEMGRYYSFYMQANIATIWWCWRWSLKRRIYVASFTLTLMHSCRSLLIDLHCSIGYSWIITYIRSRFWILASCADRRLQLIIVWRIQWTTQEHNPPIGRAMHVDSRNGKRNWCIVLLCMISSASLARVRLICNYTVAAADLVIVPVKLQSRAMVSASCSVLPLSTKFAKCLSAVSSRFNFIDLQLENTRVSFHVKFILVWKLASSSFAVLIKNNFVLTY